MYVDLYSAPYDKHLILKALSHGSHCLTCLRLACVRVHYTVFQKKFTLLLFAITKSDVDRFRLYLAGM